MKLINFQNKPLWGISVIGLFGISYWLCRFTFFDIHGMKSWPNTLAMVGLIIIVVATIFRNRIIPVATLVGYMGGFILAMIFNTDGVDPGGGGTNNAWIIWGTAFIFFNLVGIILSLISKQRYKNVKG